MKVPIYVVDAFTSRRFSGNPAAVVVFSDYPDDTVLQAIAAENNLAETAFPVARADGTWDLRWFTPTVEVALCGHATLAAAHALFRHFVPDRQDITFITRFSGSLLVRRSGAALVLNFPAMPAEHAAGDAAAIPRLQPREVLTGRLFVMAVLDRAEDVRSFRPERDSILALGDVPLILTAPGDQGFDCVSRVFAPQVGIDEDPVTGAAHTMIAPYWARVLGKAEIRAFQASPRGGELGCRVIGDRVELEGACVPYLSGEIEI